LRLVGLSQVKDELAQKTGQLSQDTFVQKRPPLRGFTANFVQKTNWENVAREKWGFVADLCGLLSHEVPVNQSKSRPPDRPNTPASS